MPKRRLILGILALGILAALTILLNRPREPSYQGRAVNSWLDTWDDHTREDLIPTREQAIRHMGTNALPYLLTAIQYEGQAPATKLSAILQWLRPFHFTRVEWDDRLQRRADSALSAFQVLGQDAAPARPELVRLLSNPAKAPITTRAALALAYTGEEGLPTLTAMLTNRRSTVQIAAIQAIARMGSTASPAVPPLTKCLKSDDAHVVRAAVETLGKLHVEPQIVAPALTDLLQSSTDPSLRSAATYALGRFGRSAGSAVPAILRVLAEPDPSLRIPVTNQLAKYERRFLRAKYHELRKEATNALRAIAPEALTNAPPK